MRTKVAINLSTDDPLEAEILDMLATIMSTHRRQERLRSLLKAGYNVLHRNMAPEQAMTEAFDSHDVALILSLFGKGAFGGGPAMPQPQQTRSDPPLNHEPSRSHQPIVERPVQRSVAAPPMAPQEPTESKPSPAPRLAPSGGYREVTGVLDEKADEEDDAHYVDVDPGILEPSPHSGIEIPEIIDPMKKLFG
jgi:hypothetical protein